MKVSLNWLREFVEIREEPRKLAADLRRLGLNPESCVQVGDDWILDVEVTTNRPDCLSHYGIAREVAALYQRPLKRPEFPVKESDPAASSQISIEIGDPGLCARYCGRVINHVKIQASPEWLVRRLEAVGQRPINNVADITNYVLMELGHPLHAFDLERISRRKIVVRRAAPAEPIRTLDGVDRKLKETDLVIADAERPVALAGVMGGEDSEISPSTRAVLLESAWFLPASIRRTAKSQGLHTEASHRFERGADIEMARLAIDRAAALMAELAGGEVLRGVVDVYPAGKRLPQIGLGRAEVLRLLGAEIPAEEIERILCALGFATERNGSEGWRVTPPSFRLDVTREADLIEEVARLYGYDRLLARVRPGPPRLERDLIREKELEVTSVLVGLGYREIIPPALIAPEENALFTDRAPVPIANPLSQEASTMRSSALPSMVRALRWNLDRARDDVKFFEFGQTYSPRAEGLAEERRVLILGLTGHRRPASVHDSARELDFFDRRPASVRDLARKLDFFDLKGDLELLFEAFDSAGARFASAQWRPFEKGQNGRFLLGNVALASFGLLSDDLSRQYKLRQRVWLAEIDLDELLRLPQRQRAVRTFSKFPSAERDFSLLVPEGTPYLRIVQGITALGLAEIRRVEPLEQLPEGKIEAGYYSLLLRVSFQSDERTLTSEEVAQAAHRMIEALGHLGVRLRGQKETH